VGLAEALGLRVGEPVVLRDVSNLLVHLRPAPVVARVATSTAMARQPVIDYFRRAEEVAGYLAARGVPVVGPSPELPAGPHLHEGFAISFAAHVRHDPGWTPEPAEFAAHLADLHRELRDYPGELPTRGPLDDIDRVLADVGDPELSALRDDLARRWSAHTTGSQALHGDAHPGNLLRTPGGPVWNDFEDTWRGPVAWDLACLSRTGRLDGAEAVARYPDPFEAADLAFHQAVRRLHAAVWLLTLARRFPEYRAEAAQQVAQTKFWCG
jgi:hypothetical protein